MNLNKRKDNFVQNLKEFFRMYNNIQKSNEYSKREIKSCGNQARNTAEVFCKSVIGEYINQTGKGKGSLYNMIKRLKRTKYYFLTNEKKYIIQKLHRVRLIGNHLSHHNYNSNYHSSIYDLNELKNNLHYLSTILIGNEETKEIEKSLIENKFKSHQKILIYFFSISILLISGWWLISYEKWIKPSTNVCINNGGVVDIDGCSATWEEAKKICEIMDKQLPPIDELKTVIKECGKEKKCYKDKGFSSSGGYWSSTTQTPNNHVWIAYPNTANCFHFSKDIKNYVRCLK